MRMVIMVSCFFVLIVANTDAQNKKVSAKAQSELATVSIVPAKRLIKLGEPIEVTVLLTAGQDGVYVQKTWGQAGRAIPGFYVELETGQGKGVELCRPIADGMPNDEPDTEIVFGRNFIFLTHGQIIGWSTTIDCPPHKPGKYLVRARYSPDLPLNERIAGLIQTRGRVILNILDAKPAEIVIR